MIELRDALVGYAGATAVTLPPALLTLWLLRTRWLAHLTRQEPPGRRGVMHDVLVGGGSALAILLLAILPPLLAGGFAQGAGFQPFDYLLSADESWGAAGLTALFVVQSLWEELFFRVLGVGLLAMLMLWAADLALLPDAQRRFGTRRPPDASLTLPVARRRLMLWLYLGLAAVLVVAVGFGVVHSGNPEWTPLAGLNIMLAGIWLGWLMWAQGHVLGAWAAHFAWNLALALAGLPVSGMALIEAPLGAGIGGARPGILTGGSFGPESSVLCTLGLLLATTWLLQRTWRDVGQTLDAVAEAEPLSTDAEAVSA